MSETKPSFLEEYEKEQEIAFHPEEALARAPKSPALPGLDGGVMLQESINNYHNMKNNPAYGLTGLIAMDSWDLSRCNITTKVGDIFLFPGTYDKYAPGYSGKAFIGCRRRPPLFATRTDGDTLHYRMSVELFRSTEDFIGFAITGYPWNDPNVKSGKTNVHNLKLTSRTCNNYWFGNYQIGSEIGGVRFDWSTMLYNACVKYLK